MSDSKTALCLKLMMPFLLLSCEPNVIIPKEKPILRELVLKKCNEVVAANSNTTFSLDEIVLEQNKAASKGEIGQIKQRLSSLRSSHWPMGKEINVCWENIDPKNPYALEVRDAVDNTWNSVFDRDVVSGQGVRFIGWGRCGENDRGLRINISDIGPKVTRLGQYLDGAKDGMFLNFTFENWGSSCQNSKAARIGCIRSIAIHEFGHALGLTHEQNRPDTPKDCTEAKQGTLGDTSSGPWDLYSVMNYCNPIWNGLETISGLDMLGVRFMYAPQIGEAFCRQLIDVMEQQEAVYMHTTVTDDEMIEMFDELFNDGL